ncbi:hypothetical protein CUMW_090010 [Citrus unshiu]|nr:hypothetical protein CUMW_090010 [Citrus unshiu]
MDSISRSEREATVSAFRTVIESLGNGVKTSLRQIRNLSRRFLEANFWLIYVYSMVFDPVFLYLPVTNDGKKCFQFDKDVMTFGILERTVYDTPFLIIRALPIWENWRRNCSISRLPVFLFDLSIILPLPQVLVLLVYNRLMNVRKFFHVMNLFIVQHLVKVMRLYALIKERNNSNKYTKWARFTFNLFYLHAANVFGALWYFFALQRKTECWRKACTDSTKCRLLPLHCDNSLTNYTFSNDFCSTKTQNATIYDFGIFFDAINSGVIEQNNLFLRLFPCIRWSLQNLSSFGQGLPFSTNVWENIFVISITITGVRLFFFLIGKVQAEEFGKQDVSSLKKLCDVVKPVVFTARSYILQEGNPIDQMLFVLQGKLWTYTSRSIAGSSSNSGNLNNHLEDGDSAGEELIAWAKADRDSSNLPLSTKTIQALTNVEAFVEEFGNWSDSSLETLCDVVKPVVFTERSYVLREGNPIDQMLFVLHDKLWTYTSRSIAGSSSNSGNPNNHLEDGDFSGEELIAWAKADRDSSNLPLSTKTIQALTKVEAFLLMADYLKQVLLDIDH